MKKLSFWARENKRTARVTIIFSYILLNLIGLFLGDVIHSLNIEFTPLFFLFAISLTLLGWMIYPSKDKKHEYKNFYIRQKSADLILVSATLLFVIYLGNSLNNNSNSFRNPLQAASIVNTNNASNISTPTVAKTTVSKKSLRQKIRAEIKSIRKAYKDSTKSQKALYIILAVLAAAGLTYVLTMFACSISCSGSEALAIVIFAVGLGGIIFGLVKLIKRITQGKPKG